MDLLPKEIKSHAPYIELKLRLSGVKHIPKLKYTDDRSSRAEKGFSDADEENEQAELGDVENDVFRTNRDDDLMSILGYNDDDDDDNDGEEEEIFEFPRDNEFNADDGHDASSAKNSLSISTAHFTHDTDNLFVGNLKESHSIQTAQSFKEELNSIQSVFNLTEERILEVRCFICEDLQLYKIDNNALFNALSGRGTQRKKPSWRPRSPVS